MENIPNQQNMPNNYFNVTAEPKRGIPTWLGLLIIIIIAVAVGLGILGYQYYVSNQNSSPAPTETPVADFSALNKNDLLHKLFPNLEFENETAKLSQKDTDNFLKLSLKDSKEDYFVNSKEKSLLLIANLEGMPHVVNLYHAYLGVFDKNGNLLTPASNFPSADSGTYIGDTGRGNDYIPENDKAHFGADAGSFGLNDCNGVEYITFVASDLPNSSCGFDSATVYKIKDGNFEIVQTIGQDKYDEHYAWHMKLSGDQLVITRSNDYLNADISECKETDYKVMNWDKTTCTFKEDATSGWKTYTNNEYGFNISFPNSWKGYSVEKSSWTGRLIDGDTQYTGVQLIFKNQTLASEKNFGGIPIMVITPDVWKLISEEKVAVSAAPIGPAKIGENQKYVFATPPRWYGFADDLSPAETSEILEIVKTFKAL